MVLPSTVFLYMFVTFPSNFPMVLLIHHWLEVRPGMELLEIAEMVTGEPGIRAGL